MRKSGSDESVSKSKQHQLETGVGGGDNSHPSGAERDRLPSAGGRGSQRSDHGRPSDSWSIGILNPKRGVSGWRHQEELYRRFDLDDGGWCLDDPLP
jgi:hypothetical protein